MAILDTFKKKKTDTAKSQAVVTPAQPVEKKPITGSRTSGNPFIIVRPFITEKAVMLSDQRKYVFLVDRHAPAAEVKKSIESLYKVDVQSINMINIVKRKANRRSRVKQLVPIRKAVVTLAKGQELDIIPK